MTTPIRGTKQSAGADLFSSVDISIPAMGTAIVPTGYLYSVKGENLCGFVRSRSGLAFKSGITAFHGTIDSDFQGKEVKVLLFNHTDTEYRVEQGQRVAQLIIVPIHTQYHFLSEDTERVGGFGSTGK